MKLSDSKKQAAIRKIIQSNEFKDSPTYRDLLLFLTKSALSGESPKESTIAMEFFKNKNINTDRDAKVRVYIHNLRKKLDTYYLNEGKEDKVKISIPKGHYLIKFIEQTEQKTKRLHRRYLIYINIFVLIGIIAGNFYFWTYHKEKPEISNNKIIRNDPIWEDFFQNDLTTLIVFGDYYLYQDTLSNYREFIRNPQINSDEDFNRFLFEDPKRKDRFGEAELTFLGKHSVWCFKNIISILLCANCKVELKLASNLQWEDFQRNNIIFIGSFKTLRIMKKYMTDVNFSYQIFPNRLFYYDRLSDSTYSYHAPRIYETGHVKDYALITKLPGPNNNVIMTFSSTHDIGHISVVNYFTNPTSLEKFKTDYLEKSPETKYFEAVFEVEGFERTGFNTHLLHFNKISSNIQ